MQEAIRNRLFKDPLASVVVWQNIPPWQGLAPCSLTRRKAGRTTRTCIYGSHRSMTVEKLSHVRRNLLRGSVWSGIQ